MNTVETVYLEDIRIGTAASYARTVAAADVAAFAELSGDVNPVHLDQAYAAATPFKGRIVHGFLAASFLSTIFGTKLPGAGCIYISQSLRFRAPVRIGDTVVAEVRAEEIVTERKRVRFACAVRVGETVVIDGEAWVMVPTRARAAAPAAG